MYRPHGLHPVAFQFSQSKIGGSTSYRYPRVHRWSCHRSLRQEEASQRHHWSCWIPKRVEKAVLPVSRSTLVQSQRNYWSICPHDCPSTSGSCLGTLPSMPLANIWSLASDSLYQHSPPRTGSRNFQCPRSHLAYPIDQRISSGPRTDHGCPRILWLGQIHAATRADFWGFVCIRESVLRFVSLWMEVWLCFRRLTNPWALIKGWWRTVRCFLCSLRSALRLIV